MGQASLRAASSGGSGLCYGVVVGDTGAVNQAYSEDPPPGSVGALAAGEA